MTRAGAGSRGVFVRPYEPADRSGVRHVCHLTGYMGEPADWYWRDAESFAEIWTGYYTDREPGSLFVAVQADQVVGYLTGCLDSHSAPTPARAIRRATFRRGLLLRPGTAGFLWRGLWDTLALGSAPSGGLEDARWPSHLHINLLPGARGCGAGTRLMRAWFERLRAASSPGCHLGALLENERAIGFFERMGFERYGTPELVPGLRTPQGRRHHVQLMVRSAPW